MPNTPLKGDYNTYIGARYVPIIGGMWNQQTEYEPLTIVMYQGSSFTSKTFVPKGTQIDNTTYWVRTANYDEQVEFYRSEVQQFKKDIDASEAEYIATVKKAQSEYEASITKQQNEYEASITKQQNEYEASITKQQNDYENNLTVRQNNYETKTTSEVQQYKKDIDASEAEYIATVQKGQEDFNSSITKQQNDYENELTKKFSSLAQSVSAPNFVNSTSEMTDSGKIYVLMPGGDVYYYNGTTFVDSGITYSANITNLSVFRHIITVGSSDSNYSTYLPDVNDVAPNTIYILNGTLNHSHTNNPANLPYWDVFSRGIILKNYCPIQGNKSANVIQELYTMDTPEHWFRFAYLWQNKLNWTDWECVYNENLKVLKSLITVGDSNSNYTSLLPDADKAATNTIYIMTGSVHSNGTGTPANFPRWDATGQFVFKNYTTLNRNAPTNAIQELYCTTNSVRWFRFASLEQDGLVWSDWKSVGTDRGSLYIKVGANEEFTSVLEAVTIAEQKMNSTVYIESGTYDIVQECKNKFGNDFFANESLQYRGIPLGNFIHIIGSSGAKLIADLTGTGFSASAIKWFSIFNSGDSNPELKNTGFTLENINATIIGGRYVVHDEHGGVLDQYTNHYKHCHFRKEKGNSAFKNVVGGGLGEHGFITFDGCTFESDIDSDTVYYHNSLYSNSGTFNSNVYFENCWFKNNSVHSDPLGTSSNKSYMYVIGCKLKSMPTGGNSDSNFEIISWNNDIT